MVEVRRSKITENDLFVRINGWVVPTPLGEKWLSLERVEKAIADHQNPSVKFAADLKALEMRKKDLSAELCAEDDPEAKEWVLGTLVENGVDISRIGHFPLSGTVYPKR